MSHRFSGKSASQVLGLSMLLCPAMVYADGWDDLWLTPDQQKRQLVEQGEFDALSASEDPAWSGVGLYKKGNYKEAAKAFEEAPGVSGRYNAATSLIHAGEYQKAIDKLNEVLEEQPDHEKARHNLDVAQQLVALQEPPPPNGEDGESGDQQDQQGEDQQSTGDENSGDQQESDQQGDSDTSEGTDNQPNSPQDQPGSDQNDSEQNQDSGSSEADQQQQEEQQNESSDREEFEANQAEAELSEDQQATEQWLRRIPDDPTGLLRRKLRRSHQSEYPTTTDSKTPW